MASERVPAQSDRRQRAARDRDATQLSLEAAQNERYRVWRRLASVVGDLGLAPQPLDGTIEAAIPELDRDAMIQAILSQSPELKAARLAVERALAALKRGQREPVPDLVVRGGPRYNRELLEANGHPVRWEAAVDVGFVLPLFNRNQCGIAEARAALRRAELREQLEIAAPIIGGMVTSTIHVLIITPVIFYLMKRRALRKGTLKVSGMTI